MKNNLHNITGLRHISATLLISVFVFVTIGATSQTSYQAACQVPAKSKNTQTSMIAISNYLAAQQNVDLSDEEKIKAAINTYFTIRYEGQKSIVQQDFSSLVEDDTLDWVMKEKDKREIELYIASLFDLGYQSYKFNLDYDSIDIKNSKAVVELRESHAVIFRAIAPDESMLFNLPHTLTLHYKNDAWIIHKDEYKDELSQQLKHMTKDDIKKQVDENFNLQNIAQPVETSSRALTNFLYNRTMAVNYANIHSSVYNANWYTTEEADCTNYTSQALYAGGGKAPPDTRGMTTSTSRDYDTDWYYDFFTKSGSKPWLRVQPHHTFITQNTSDVGPIGWNTSNLCYTQPGDIVQLQGVNTPGEWGHEGIIVVTGSCTNLSTYKVNAHTNDRYQYPLSNWASFPKRYLIITGYRLDISSMSIFADVPSGYWAKQDIERLYSDGITSGCNTNPLRYCPEDGVTRAQMAVFLLKGIYGPSYSPPPVGTTTYFSDVAITHWAAAWIKQFATLGITGGCATNPARYCPENITTHAEMAIFLLRSKHYGSFYTPSAVGSTTYFADVPTDFWAGAWIKQEAFDDISYGAYNCTPGNYCPIDF